MFCLEIVDYETSVQNCSTADHFTNYADGLVQRWQNSMLLVTMYGNKRRML